MTMNEIEQHDSQWADRLQDLLDGELAGADRSALETHAAACARCRAQLNQLKRVDALLKRQVEHPSVGPGFDQQVLARINAEQDQAPAQLRRRMEQELQENLRALARGWRGSLLSAIGGAIAGMALSLAFVTWAQDAGLGASLLNSVHVSGQYSDMLRMLMPLAIGAAMGAAVSRWLTGSAS